jgi:hypothetical protein
MAPRSNARAGRKGASRRAWHGAAAGAQSTQESGQVARRQTGQFHLLPTLAQVARSAEQRLFVPDHRLHRGSRLRRLALFAEPMARRI